MTRTLAGHIAYALFRHAASEKYPTRSVEHMLAWMLVVWSAACALPQPVVMSGPTFEYLIAIAPEWWWGYSGVTLGLCRLAALYINGNWRRTPVLRLFGAMLGMIWWIIISALYWVAVSKGAPDFPMRYVLFVVIFFEGYSCFRCGQDHASPMARDAFENG